MSNQEPRVIGLGVSFCVRGDEPGPVGLGYATRYACPPAPLACAVCTTPSYIRTPSSVRMPLRECAQRAHSIEQHYLLVSVGSQVPIEPKVRKDTVSTFSNFLIRRCCHICARSLRLCTLSVYIYIYIYTY